MCYTSTPWVVLASEPCYKVSVDGALSEENERSDLGLLLKQGEDDDHEAIELEEADDAQEAGANRGPTRSSPLRWHSPHTIRA